MLSLNHYNTSFLSRIRILNPFDFIRISLLLLTFIAMTLVLNAQNANQRVYHNDPSNYRTISSVHDGAGDMKFTGVIGSDKLSGNFLYLHAGEIHSKGGIGHHFHHKMEEMYVLLSGEAEFTINGRTSLLKAPVVVPCKMGDAHAVYNHTGETVKWLNFAVSKDKRIRDRAFDLGDDRVGASLDDVPVFVSGALDKDKLRIENHMYAEEGAQYRRVLHPGVFSTNWNHVDHLVLPKNKSTGSFQLKNIEAVYYIMNGSGTISIEGVEIGISKDDVVLGMLGENINISNANDEDLEILIIGISATPNGYQGHAGPPDEPIAMVLQMDFVVSNENARAFEEMYHSIYVPAMTVQDGYLSSKLLRLFPKELAAGIEAEPTVYNYQIQISFDTEENRRKWVASDQHQIAWPAATSLAKEYKWRGYDVMGEDGR